MPQSHRRRNSYRNPEDRQRKRLRFIDIEAKVSDEGEEADDNDNNNCANDFFIEAVGTADEDDNEDSRHHVQLDKHRQLEEDEISPEDIARQLTDRYKSCLPSRFTGNTNEIPQRLLVPSVHAPGLWWISVKVFTLVHLLIYSKILSSPVMNKI